VASIGIVRLWEFITMVGETNSKLYAHRFLIFSNYSYTNCVDVLYRTHIVKWVSEAEKTQTSGDNIMQGILQFTVNA
jgi:hypothetical protein